MEAAKAKETEWYEKLMSWNMSDVKDRIIHDCNVTEEYADRLIAEYRRFISICVAFPGVRFPISKEVDVAWHTHLLFTRDYAEMSKQINGTFIHHQPLTKKTEAAEAKKSYAENTRPRLEELYGRLDEHFWPRVENFVHCSFKCSD